MSKHPLIQKLENTSLKTLPTFRVGDTLKIHTRIIEGEKERVQIFIGIVIARKGFGLAEHITVRRVAFGEGVERVFFLHSPRIAKIELVSEGRVRRAKLYYLCGTQGKASKVKHRIRARTAKNAATSTSSAEESLSVIADLSQDNSSDQEQHS